MYCKNCGKELNDYQVVCLNCGCAVGTGKKYCANCGGELGENASFCLKCGAGADFGAKIEEVAKEEKNMSSAEHAPQQQPVINIVNTNTNANSNINNNGIFMKKPKNKWVALLLCFFFGILGAHKFYEGKMGMGLLYLFTGGLAGIGVIIDFISLLFKSNPYYV